MVKVRRLLMAAVAVSLITSASAQPSPTPASPAPTPVTAKPGAPALLVGAAEVLRVAPVGELVDAAITADDTRLAYVVNTGPRHELRVLTLATRVEQVIDLTAALTPPAPEAAPPAPGAKVKAKAKAKPKTKGKRPPAPPPLALDESEVQDFAGVVTPPATEVAVVATGAPLTPLALTLHGPRALLVAGAEDGAQHAIALDLVAGDGAPPERAVAWRAGPAAHVTVVTRDGAARVALHRVTPTAAGVRHDVELRGLDGKVVGRGKPLELGATGVAVGGSTALELTVNHWSEGWTRAHGIKAGAWNRKLDERSPNTEATYDLVTGRVVDDHAITDLFEQRRRFQALAEAGALPPLLRLTWDRLGIVLWSADATRSVTLDGSLRTYDAASLQGAVEPRGGWLALTVDPVNAEAVARKKADPVYTDVFRVTPEGAGLRATRTARVFAKHLRHQLGGAGADRFWLLERASSGAAPTLTVYAPAPAAP